MGAPPAVSIEQPLALCTAMLDCRSLAKSSSCIFRSSQSLNQTHILHVTGLCVCPINKNDLPPFIVFLLDNIDHVQQQPYPLSPVVTTPTA